MSTELHHMISFEELDTNKFKSTITFDGELVRGALEKSAKQVNKSVKVNGFRQGKVPLKILENFHPEKISGGAMNMLMDEGFRLTVQENKFMPLRDPKLLKINTYPDKEDGFEFELEIDGMYEIDPIGYLNMKLEVPKYNVDKSIDEYLKYLKSQHPQMVESEEVQDGSNIKCDYSIRLGDELIGEDKDQTVPVYDTELTIFGSQLLGAKKNSSVEYDYVLPENFPKNPGEKVTIVIDIKEIFERRDPDLEELVKSLGTTEEKLMEFAKHQVNSSLENNKMSVLNEQIVDKLVETNEFEPPAILVDEELNIIKAGNQNHCGERCGGHDHGHHGCDGDGCGDKYNCEKEDCDSKSEDEELRSQAEKRVKSAYILNRIYNMEAELAITKDEVNKFLEMEAQSQGTTKQILLKKIKENNVYDQFIGNLRNRKIMSFIMSNATITEREEEETQVEETQVEETQVEETQVEETQVEETQVEETQTDGEENVSS